MRTSTQFPALLGRPPLVEPKGSTAVTAKGFRLFFLLAAAFAVLALPAWLLALHGIGHPGTGYLDPVTWHAHEMVFGYAVAVVAGFLLTAVSNWTGRETATGASLVALAGVWGAGRVALLLGGVLPGPMIAIIDLSFVPALMIAIGRPLVATRNRRNLVMLVALSFLLLANAAMHLDANGALAGIRRRALIAGVDVIILLAVIIAGRVIPMFTKNATGTPVRSRPSLDIASALLVVGITIVDLVSPASRYATLLCGAGAVAIGARAVQWAGRAVGRHPLLWILHLGHGWIAVGLALRAVAPFVGIPDGAGIHALTAGAIGALTIGMMARVTLGHTGRLLQASRATTAAFALVLGAAVVRVGGYLLPSYRLALIASGLLWTGAFALFLIVHVPMLLAPRVDGKPG